MITNSVPENAMKLCEAKCRACRETFSWPELGDFVYGEVLFHGIHGTVHAHVTLIGNPVFDIVCATLPETADVHETLAKLADPLDGQALTTRRICPLCASTDWEYWGGQALEDVTIPAATFKRFEAQPAAMQRQMILG